MGLIIDTCIFIQSERESSQINFNHMNSDEPVFISVVTMTELLVGVHLADAEGRRLKRSAFVEAILSEISILDFTAEVARIHAELFAYLAREGQLIGAHDLIIAATAIAYGHQLLTTNTKEFQRVPGLKLLK